MGRGCRECRADGELKGSFSLISFVWYLFQKRSPVQMGTFISMLYAGLDASDNLEEVNEMWQGR